MDFTPPALETPPPAVPTDAQLAGAWASEAFRLGRYALGEAIGRIALKAHIADLHQASTMLTASAPTPVHDQAATGVLYLDPTAGRLSMPTAGEFLAPTAPETSHCLALMIKDGVKVNCDAVIYKVENEGVPGQWWWDHVHTGINSDHSAIGPLADYERSN